MADKRKRIHRRMKELAKEIGAVDARGREDWYAVAEHYAALHEPWRLTGAAKVKGAGRPLEFRGIVDDVEALIRRRKRGFAQACRDLAAGEMPYKIKSTTPGKFIKMSTSRWTDCSPVKMLAAYKRQKTARKKKLSPANK